MVGWRQEKGGCCSKGAEKHTTRPTGEKDGYLLCAGLSLAEGSTAPYAWLPAGERGPPLQTLPRLPPHSPGVQQMTVSNFSLQPPGEERYLLRQMHLTARKNTLCSNSSNWSLKTSDFPCTKAK